MIIALVNMIIYSDNYLVKTKEIYVHIIIYAKMQLCNAIQLFLKALYRRFKTHTHAMISLHTDTHFSRGYVFPNVSL